MTDSYQNQMMYLAAWSMLKKLCNENKIDFDIANKINTKNAEMLMCDLLPII